MQTWGMVGVLCLVVACGDDDGASADAAVAAPDASVDAMVSPYCPPSSAATDTATNMVFLNFEGVAVTPGAEDATQNTSNVITVGATVPPLLDGQPGRDAVIADVVAGVETILAPYDIGIVTTRPATGPYQMVVFGGTGTALGLPDAPSQYPINCNVGPGSQVLFVFDKGLSAETMASFVIAGLGTSGALPSTNVAESCMCIVGTNCGPRTELCTIIEGDVALASQVVCRPAGTTEIDEAADFKAAYGCR